MKQRAQTYYRRHAKCSVAGRKGNSFEPDERRGWKPCACPIYFYGTLRPGEKAIRRSTAVTDWREADEVVNRWRAGLCEPEPPRPTTTPGTGKTTVEAAGKAYVAEHERVGSATSTIKKYRILTRKVTEFTEGQKHYGYLDQWTTPDVREFLAWWGGAPRTQSKNHGHLKAYFEFCNENGWMKENVARFRERKNRVQREAAGEGAQKSPFTDAELTRMLDACEHKYGKREIKWSRTSGSSLAKGGETANYRYAWTGEDLADFILISTYTGLRISDVATFHISRLLEGGDIHLRATKNGTWVDTWIPEWLQARIRARAARVGPLIFGAHETKDMDVVTDVWRRKLNALWKLCGEWKEKPTHHRFRHTFVRVLLQRGVDVATVAELIGDTEKMVRKHYSKWVTERQERIRAVLREAFQDAPTVAAANVIPFRK